MDKNDISHVEIAQEPPTKQTGLHVELYKDGKPVLVPTPSADPRGMLKLLQHLLPCSSNLS